MFVPLDLEDKKRFELKQGLDSDGTIRKYIFIDGELFDWSVDQSSLLEAAQMGPKYFKEVQKSIGEHFVESISDVLGRKVTAEEIKMATKTGWI